MTIDELYEKLQDPDFQDTATGQLFFPAYMYLYDVAQEAEIERRLDGIKEGLHRPSGVALVGYSLGARLALQVAVLRPDLVTAVVALGGNPGLLDGASREARLARDRDLASRLREMDPTAFASWLREEWYARALRRQPSQQGGRHPHPRLPAGTVPACGATLLTTHCSTACSHDASTVWL